MAAIMNGSVHSTETGSGGLQFKFLAHVQSLPLVNDSLDQLYAHPLGRNASETIKHVSSTAFKFTGPINPLLQRADSLADSGLKNIESRFPLVKAPTSEIKEKTSGVAKTTVDTYVGAIHDRFGLAASKAKENGHAAADYATKQTNGARHTLHDVIDPYAVPVLDKVEGLLDTYLPKAQAKIQNAKNSAEDEAPAAQAKAEHTIGRVYDISTSLFDRSTNAAKNTIGYGADVVVGVATTATSYAQWTVQNPSKVPEAAIEQVHAGTAAVRERVDETVKRTRGRAASVSEYAVQAYDVAIHVYEKEKRAAPKDQPRGLIITSINTALVLTGKTLDHAKTYFQESPVANNIDVNGLKKDASDAADKVQAALPRQEELKDAVDHTHEQAHKKAKHATQSIDDIVKHQEHN